MNNPPILSLENIVFAYPDRPCLFDNLCFSLREGEHIGFYGPNGSGKTTFLRLLMGLEEPASGGVFYRGRRVVDSRALHELRCGVGFVLQNSDDQLFSITVLEDVAFGPLNLGMSRVAARERAMETLEGLGLGGLAGRSAHRLSGGEKKMVSMASVLSMSPGAILLDEPTASLDDEARGRVIGVLRGSGLARVVVSHDRDFLERTSSSFMSFDGCGGVVISERMR